MNILYRSGKLRKEIKNKNKKRIEICMLVYNYFIGYFTKKNIIVFLFFAAS